VAEPKVMQKLSFIRIGRYGYFQSEMGKLDGLAFAALITCPMVKLPIFIFCEK